MAICSFCKGFCLRFSCFGWYCNAIAVVLVVVVVVEEEEEEEEEEIGGIVMWSRN